MPKNSRIFAHFVHELSCFVQELDLKSPDSVHFINKTAKIGLFHSLLYILRWTSPNGKTTQMWHCA